ncbi:phosphatidylinositide phosphatase SAC1-A-like protein, partial [Dinothrombium tinctorium]
HTTPEKFFLKSESSENEVLVIDRVSHQIAVEDSFKDTLVDTSTSRVVYGLFGIVHLLAGPYLIVITKISKAAEIYNQIIWKVEETEVLSFCKTTWHLTDEQVQHNNTYLSMVKSVLATPYFYFSYSYDISHTLQRLNNAGPDFMTSSLFDRAEQRFVWNRHLLRDFSTKSELKPYCIPIIHGFISSEVLAINNKVFTWTLVSRRSILRAGTRMFSRGIDKDGNVSNYVETEQIVEYENSRSSFVQIRGSAPLFWTQLPNLRYKPPPQLSQFHNHLEALQKHMESLICNYGKVVVINLVNQTGSEHVIEKTLRENLQLLNNSMIRYEAFDFHKECSKMRWDRLSILMNRISQEQSEFGYFITSRDGIVLASQEGVFRTNCIDSLDRTNVVQSLIAKRSLEDQLKRFLILAPGEKIGDHPHVENIYRKVWADNADFCSIQYAGTGALKTDYTRTGKRTRSGLIKDGINSLLRYYKNNFADGFRQDSIDLFLGYYKPDENEGKLSGSPLTDKKDWKYLVLPTILLGSIAMFFFSMFIPAEHSTETLMYLIFWSGMVSFSLAVIVYYGGEFVDHPKLCEVRP